jgi:putative salt-induced outer membrane protein YdiY
VRNWKSTIFIALVIALATFDFAEAQAPKAAAPPPTPPAAGGADKPTGDALAQEAEAKPPEAKDEKEKKHSPYSGKVAAGFNFTSGNSNTKSFNLAVAMKYDPQTKNVFKAEAFYLRNIEAGASTVDRTTAHLRDEYSLGPRWFAFGDGQFLKDQFKGIDSLISTTAGAGVRLIKTSERELTADLGAGAIFEKDQNQDRTSGGALRAGESYNGKISKSAGFTQNAFAIWKTSDFADAYYHFDVGLGAEIDEHFELKVALIDEYKRKPPDPAIKRNDVAGIVQLEAKF